MIRSESSASATMAVAASASTNWAGGLPAARCPREEDHAVGVPRDVLERAHHARLTPAFRAGQRDRRPHPRVELAAKLLDQAPLVLREVDVALGDQHLAVARLHPKEAHAAIMSK